MSGSEIRPPSFVVRSARAADVAQIVRLFFDTIHKVNIRDYSAAQVAAWAPRVPDAARWMRERFGRFETFVADDGGMVVGFAELADGTHIECFYCHHAHQRRGIGRALYDRLERAARDAGRSCLRTEASITARPFFERLGFCVLTREVVRRNGQELPRYVMEKRLDGSKG